jgi:hypothetical protein
MYHISQYTYERAFANGIYVYPSENRRWKIEVYDGEGLFLCYCGNTRLKDYPTYLEEKGLYAACRKRHLWFRRHGYNPQLFDYATPEWAESILLW